MYIGAINSGVSAALLNNYQMHSQRVSDLQKKAAAGTSFLSAKDNPAMVGTMETLKSQISENAIIAGSINPSKTELDGLGSLIQGAIDRVGLDITQGDAGALKDVVNTLRSMATWSSDVQTYFNGDPAHPEMITVNHAATSASLSSSGLNPLVTLAQDSTVKENGVDVAKSTLDVSVDGVTKQVQLDAGDYNTPDLVSALQSSLDSAFGSGKVSLSLDNGTLNVTSLSTSTTSQLNFSGTIASALGISGTAKGADAWTEQVQGAPGPKDIVFSGREITFFNANALADKIEASLGKGDLSGALTEATNAKNMMNDTEVTVGTTSNLLGFDLGARVNSSKVLTQRLDNLTQLDPSTADDLAKEELRMQQAAWAITAMNDTYTSNIKILLGLQ